MKISRARVIRWEQGNTSELTDELATEEPLEMRVGKQTVGITMRTPGHDIELTAGFLLTEGLLRPDTLPLLKQDHPNRVTASVQVVEDSALQRLQRYGTISSSCGLCGKASIESVHQHFAPVDTDFTVPASAAYEWPRKLQEAQPGFARTGGLHAAAIFDTSGEPLVIREDIGRHNAVDKAIGYSFLRKRLPLSKHVLLVSGRASFEIVQKALGAGIPIIAAVSAPSSLAVQFAEASGQTLVGFLREGKFNVYTHPERLA
jgi:FdhD protein